MTLLGVEAGSAGSKTSAVYRRLRTDLLAGKFAPGERLKIGELAEALKVNPTAVREALQRLVPEQLVVSRDQKGFAVAPLSVEDLVELTEVRCEVEAFALRRSVALGDFAWEAGVLAAAHHLRRTAMVSAPDHLINPEWAERHRAYHYSLVSGCNNRRLLGLHVQLYEQSERYRGLSLALSAPAFAGRNVEAEHQEIVDAAIERDANRLVELVIAHIQETTDLIIAAAKRAEPVR